MRQWWALGLVVAVLCVAVPARAEDEELPIVNRRLWELKHPAESNAWSRQTPWWEAWNQGAGTAYARAGDRARLEAQSICQPPRAFHQAAARATYRWVGGFHGMTSVRPVGWIYGQLITGTGIAGTGEAEAKITFEVRDVTTGSTEVYATLHQETSPQIIRDLLSRQQPLENRTKEKPFHTNWFTFHMNQGHTYEATVKLWTECSVWGAYMVRADYSRHTISTAEDPLIGMVLLDKLTFDFRGARHGSGEGME